MRKVEVVKAHEVEVKPLDLSQFTNEYTQRKPLKTLTKKEIREMANVLGLSYDETQIAFTKKLMNAYIEKETK